jgi:hypothetical protein
MDSSEKESKELDLWDLDIYKEMFAGLNKDLSTQALVQMVMQMDVPEEKIPFRDLIAKIILFHDRGYYLRYARKPLRLWPDYRQKLFEMPSVNVRLIDNLFRDPFFFGNWLPTIRNGFYHSGADTPPVFSPIQSDVDTHSNESEQHLMRDFLSLKTSVHEDANYPVHHLILKSNQNHAWLQVL